MRVWMLRSLSFLVLGVLCVAGACGIDDLLVGAACADDEDCPNLTCVRTLAQENNDGPGVCSSDGSCVPGQQEGCLAGPDGACGFGLTLAASPDGPSYCCDSGQSNPTIVQVSEADGSADCFDCPSCEFMSGVEPCFADEDRCELENEDDPCGCRPTDDSLLGENCDGDDNCGPAGVCVRTLEELEEPAEPINVDQALEQGVCRPADMPTCMAGGQPGCEVDGTSSCPSGTTEVDVQTRSFCCRQTANNSAFQSLPYVVSEDLTSVACTACPREDCDDMMGNATLPVCTSLTDPECIVPAGLLCGCTPEVQE